MKGSLASIAFSACAVLAAGALVNGVNVIGARGEQAPGAGTPKAANPDDWLLNAPDDEARWKLIQDQMRGFSASMKEVGERYQSLYSALGDGNYDLAEYQLKKIKEVIVAGYTRRPKRQPNADAIFVNGVYEPALAEIKSGDPGRAWAAFAQVREGCMACHAAEKLPFLNNQPVFRNTEKPRE